MKKFLIFILTILLVFSITACGSNTDQPSEPESEVVDYAGTYIGYSWNGESKGTMFSDATQKVQTILTLDSEGEIMEAKMLFWKQSGSFWYTRQDGTARVSVDLGITPKPVTLAEEYKIGTSMFTIDTHDKMSFYAAKVDIDGTAGLLLVEPISRYQFEIKLPTNYDYSTLLKDIKIDGTEGGFIPTERASSKGLQRPKALEEFSGKHIFNIESYFPVMTERGVFKGLSGNSTVQEMFEATGITFADGMPMESELITGFHSLGGWAGNYEAVEKFLVGKNAMEVTSLVDWSVERWSGAVNEDNYFGVDVASGATKTAQNSSDTITGATVRMSRESTSYQRALVNAGIIEESEVIKGRF